MDCRHDAETFGSAVGRQAAGYPNLPFAVPFHQFVRALPGMHAVAPPIVRLARHRPTVLPYSRSSSISLARI